MTRSFLLIIGVAALASLTPGLAFAGPITVDGRVLPNESYYTWTVTGTSGDVSGIGPIRIHIAQDAASGGVAGDVYMAYVVPTSFVDNSYGAYSNGWGGVDKHKFGELTGSDKAEFQFFNDTDGTPGIDTTKNDDLVFDATMDYLQAKDGNFYSGWGTNTEGKVDVGDETDIRAGVTSLDWNLNQLLGGVVDQGGHNYTEDSPETNPVESYDVVSKTLANGKNVDDWVFEVVYEFSIKGSFFGEQILNSDGTLKDNWQFVVSGLHASPHKIGGSNDLVPVPPTGPPEKPGGGGPGGVVPLPSGVWAGLMVLAGLGVMRIRRRRLSAASR